MMDDGSEPFDGTEPIEILLSSSSWFSYLPPSTTKMADGYSIVSI
jgi:hypothetical protein